MKLEIKNFPEISSTQTYCVKNLQEISATLDECDVYCVFAEKQTEGTGKYGRKWESPKGNFSATYAMKIDFPIDYQNVQIVQRVAVAAIRTLDDFSVHVDVKWVNDLLINGKKIGGILCECVKSKDQNYLLAGIGINLQHAPEYASSVEKEYSMIINPEDIVSRLGENLAKCMNSNIEEYDSIALEYKSRLIEDAKQYNIS